MIIQHRVNTSAALTSTPMHYGVEVDIRTEGQKLIIHHDPFSAGEDFERWMNSYAHRFIILNVKEEGLEARLLRIMAQHSVRDFFFLDQSFPFLIKTSREGEHRCAVRVSEFESIDTALTLQGKVEWVWVDCFTRFPLVQETAQQLQDARFKLCLVSPELQGRTDPQQIYNLRTLLEKQAIQADAVCTKRPDLWQ